jgi:hypothetical protein
MFKRIFEAYNFQTWLFLLAGIGFVLSLLKNLFLTQHPGAGYYVIEILAFMFFLTAFFVCDKNNYILSKRIREIEQENNERLEKDESKIRELKEIINRYELEKNESTHLATYQDKIIGRIVSDKIVYHDKHHLLYLISELFHGMAAIMYKKDKPSGKFNVETIYGMPEDFEAEAFDEGEGIHGQAVKDKKAGLIEDVPPDYISVSSALGQSNSYFLYMLPVVNNDECTRLIELMTFRETEVERLWPGVMVKLVEKEVV